MDKELILFGKADCGLCQGWKKKLENFKIPFKYVDLGDAGNLAEFTFQGFTKMPAIVIGENRFEEIKPSDLTIQEIEAMIKNG